MRYGIGAATNIVLDAVFVAVLDWGVTGAAWATVIGQILSALFGTYLVLKGCTKAEMERGTFSFDFRLSKKMISCGFAFWIAQMAMGLISLVYNSQLGRYGGDIAISVYAVVASIMTFVIMPVSGISQGIQPIVGNNFGAKNYKRVMAALYQASAFSVGITCIIWLIVMLSPEAILLAFGASDEMLEIGVSGLRTNFCITPILGFVMLVTTFFQSIAKPVPSIVITFLRQILFLIPFIYIFPVIWDMNGIFVAQPVSDALALILSAVFVVKEKRQLYSMSDRSGENSPMTQ